MTTRFLVLALSVSAMMLQAAKGDEVRHTKFVSSLLGNWAPSKEQCGGKQKLSFSISEAQFSSPDGDCKVQWIVERAAARGTTYGVHARCLDSSQPEKASTVDLIIWPQGSESISIGTAFDNLKVYQRCPSE